MNILGDLVKEKMEHEQAVSTIKELGAKNMGLGI